ncbi:hypothetical protein QYE76_059445 [Lolium multiflorum]|uniref:Reverse transcriptase Ty1/copia-type domain-containing protein n=1 Tax=Lolium multiflorum TaxID=4521 RepID=A0AAD8RZD3_LOLMU|nr:hypothetical protein QYE76_059445 [Lolium multiflorum]
MIPSSAGIHGSLKILEMKKSSRVAASDFDENSSGPIAVAAVMSALPTDRKFEMSMMGELKFFLGFQVRQLAKGTFISQEKYVKDMLKKFNMTNASPMKTPMPVKGQLASCDGEKDVDIKKMGNTSQVDDPVTSPVNRPLTKPWPVPARPLRPVGPACGSSDDDRGSPAKRGRLAPRPPSCRTSTRKPSKAPQPTDTGSSARVRNKSIANRRKDKHAAQEDDEIVPDFNIADANRLEWQDLRTVNPYRYEQRTYTGGDMFFWTKTQAALWDGFYNTQECMKNGVVVKPKAINPEELALHEATKYRFVVETLKGMGLYDLVCLKPDDEQEDPTYCPLLVRQFHCTVFFHDDADRTMTWMTGREKYSCTYTQFCAAMGIRKIDGCDLIHCEKRAAMDRMTPNYAQYVQRLINYIVPAPLNTLDERVIMAPFKFPTQEGRPEVPSMMPSNEHRSKEHHDPAASSSYSRRPKHGAARFFSSMWQMCKNTNDVAHQSLALNQETRRRHNEFMATRNAPVPPSGPEMEPVAAPQWEMPHLTDEMIQNFDFSMYAHGGLPPRTARDADDDEEEEDEGDKDDDEERDGEASYSTGHEFF